MKKLSYKHTLVSCYIGYVVQAIVCNFAPLLFVTLSNEYNISLSKITSLIILTFFVQIIVDGLSAKYVDKMGYRVSLVLAHILSALGFVLMGTLPSVIDPYTALIIAVIVYSLGSGLLEVLVSPIVEACPTENKKGNMSFLHSFYCWGSAFVILATTLFFAVFGRENWKVLSLLWAIIPIANAIYILFIPINNINEVHEKVSIKDFSKNKLFYIVIGLMMTAGASELAMSQWASTFAETGLNVSKTVGDLAGPCFFAILMGIARVLYSAISHKVNMVKYMIFCGGLCAFSYLLTTLSPSPVLSLIGCGICGFSVGVLWPGTISIASKHLGGGGTAFFAFLALAGDVGCTVGPSVIGFVSDKTGGISNGLIYGIIFPIVLIILLVILLKTNKKKI